MGTIVKEYAIGVFVALFAMFGCFFLYIEYFSENTLEEFYKVVLEKEILGKVLSLVAIPNLFVFLVFIKKKQDYRARGVLFLTIIIALTTLFLKFL